MGGLLHLVQRGGDWAWPQPPPRPLLAVPNETAHPSAAGVPITVLLYNGLLVCGFNVAIKGSIFLTLSSDERSFHVVGKLSVDETEFVRTETRHNDVTAVY